jgi:hypothetical protein
MSSTRTETIHHHRQSPTQFVLFTLIAAVVATLAAWSSAALRLEPWVMFTGFIAWFTRPTSSREGVNSVICLWLGIGLAAAAHTATAALASSIGGLALPVIVFLVAIVVVGLRTTKIVDNMLSWFLGLVAFFAADLQPSLEAFVHLGGASAIGGFAGWTCQALNRRWAGA